MATRSRVRKRIEKFPSSILGYYSPPPPGGTLYGTVNNPVYGQLLKSEILFDEYDAPKVGPGYSDHACDHTRIEGTSELVKPFWHGGSIVYVPKTFYWYASPESIRAAVPPIPSSLLDELAYAALEKFKDDIEEEGSLLNFIYELKDFAGLIGAFSSLVHRLFEFFSKPGLSWSFAIKPFLEDLQKLFGVFEKVKRRIEFLKKNNGKVVDLNYTRKGVESQMDDIILFLLLDNSCDMGALSLPLPLATPHLRDVKITFRAHAKVKIDCTGLDRFDRQLDAYVEALGLRTLFQWLKAGYKAIPFSWLLDFFVRTGRIFDLTKTPVFGGIGSEPIKVLSTTHSIKVEAEVWLFGKEYHEPTQTVVGKYKVKLYKRSPGLPFSGGDGILRYHDLSENLSMLAILLQIILPGLYHGRRT